MKKYFALLLLAARVLPARAQTLPEIAATWRNKDYQAKTVDAEGVARAFAAQYPDNALIQLLYTSFAEGEQKGCFFSNEKEMEYILLRPHFAKNVAELQVKLWRHPKGIIRAAVKIQDDREDPVAHLFLFAVSADGKMTPMADPEGLPVDDVHDYSLPPEDDAIGMDRPDNPYDYILPRKDGTFKYMAHKKRPDASLSCYVMDSDRYTNLRKSPGGSVLGRLDNSENEYVITICEPSNGWWRIFDDFVGSMELSGEAWIHYSVLGMRTRNYGGQALPLRASASEQAAVVATIKEEEATVRPMDISADGKWTKVKCDAGTGWLESRWLCGNPYTTCP